VAGCAHRVTRLETTQVTDLSGRWNDTDSRLVAEAMVTDCLKNPWWVNFPGKQPAVIVGTVRNKSHEHISANTFIKDIEQSLINSGRVKMVASKEERDEVRAEREDMQEYASEETIKKFGREHGADFMMSGTIDSILDEEGHKRVVYYQVSLQLINLETNEKAWLGSHKIKKLIER
jgi:uncharacterized protein (TIGR02722 family)